MISPDYIRQEFEKLYKEFWEQRLFLIKYSQDLSVQTIYQIRSLVRDLVTISVAIVGIVVPLLLSSSVTLNKRFIALAVIIFTSVIIYGILLLFSALKKDFEGIPNELDRNLDKIDKTMSEISVVINNPTEENAKTFSQKIFKRPPNEEREGTKWRNIVNNDALFLSLFILGIILLIFSLYEQ